MTKRFRVSFCILIGLIAIIILFIYQYRAAIFQRGNPIPYVSKMFSLDDDTAYIDVFGDKREYLTKRYESDALFQYVEKEYGVIYKEQMGSGYVFEAEGHKIILTSQIYWKYYVVWTLTKDKDSLDNK